MRTREDSDLIPASSSDQPRPPARALHQRGELAVASGVTHRVVGRAPLRPKRALALRNPRQELATCPRDARGMEAIYDDVNAAPVRFQAFAPAVPARSPMFSARTRLRAPGQAPAPPVGVAESDLY